MSVKTVLMNSVVPALCPICLRRLLADSNKVSRCKNRQVYIGKIGCAMTVYQLSHEVTSKTCKKKKMFPEPKKKLVSVNTDTEPPMPSGIFF